MLSSLLEDLTHLSLLARFALAMTVILVVPTLCEKVRLPSVVGLLLASVLFGPHGLLKEPMLNSVIVLMVVTSILGLILTDL